MSIPIFRLICVCYMLKNKTVKLIHSFVREHIGLSRVTQLVQNIVWTYLQGSMELLYYI